MNTINKPKVNVILIIIFVIISGIITYFLINNKISSLNKANDFTTDIPEETNKKKANDTYLGIKLGDTYNQNDLSYKTICYDDGNEREIENSYFDYCRGISYLRFEGLKNKTVLNKINEEIKNKVYDLKENYSSVGVNINSNFSNILSIVIYYQNENNSNYLYLNYDLNTGDKLKFLDLFTSDTPINSIIAESAYENLAWSSAFNDEDGYTSGSADMNDIDTKEYEDEILKIVNKFQTQKDNLNFSINTNSILIYNLTDTALKIEYRDYKEYIALFKRYAVNTSLYEQNDVGLKNIFIMTTPFTTINTQSNNRIPKESIYGFLTDNFYADVTLYDKYDNINSAEINKKVTQDVNSKLEEMVSSLKKASDTSSKGIVFQVVANYGYAISNDYDQEDISEEIRNEAYIEIEILYSKMTMPQENFKNNLLEELIIKSYQPKASVMQLMFFKDEVANSKVEATDITYYYDINGNYIGNTSNEYEPEY